MRIVLLSGGSGKRLWPLSNEIRSKIFLKLLETDDGGRESMIQRVCRHLDSAGLLQSASIVTHESQVEITQYHVGERIPILSENHKRGTFTAIALAVVYFHSFLHADPDEIVCCLPVDSLVEPAFFGLIRQAPEMLRRSNAELALIGTAPYHPSDQYGYIVPKMAKTKNDYYAVDHFVEKPDKKTASGLIKKKALWNCGVFAFSIGFMLSRLRSQGLPLVYEELLAQYEHLPELSFDQEIVEKTRHVIVIPYDGAWKDLGSWTALTDHLGTNIIGSGAISDDSVNTHLINDLPYPVYVIDVPNIIVAASPDGILVASKTNSSRIKQMIANVRQRPMYEERRWGICQVLDQSKPEPGVETLTNKIRLFPGKHISYQLHHKRKEIWTILSGSGELLLDGILSLIQAGDVVQIPRGTKHGVRAITPIEMIEVQIGSELDEDDITRLAMTWEEAVRLGKSKSGDE